MWTINHHFGENISWKSQSQCCHFCNNVASINHMVTPSVHNWWPFREINWNLVGSSINWISNVPEISPLGIEWRWNWSKSFILRFVSFDKVFMSSGFFCVLWSSTNLEVIVGINVSNLSALIEISSSFSKIFLHHVEKFSIFLLVDSGIFDDQATIFL